LITRFSVRDKTINEAQDAQDKRERDGLIRHRENLLAIADKYDAQAIASIQTTAEGRGITYEDAEDRIYKIQTDAFDRRLQAAKEDEARFYAQQKDLNDVDLDLAQQYADRIAAIVAEQEGVELEHERKTDAGRRRDIDNERAYLENMRRMKAEAVADALDIERMEIEAAARNGGQLQTRAERLSTIRSLAESERKQEEQNHKQRQQDIEDQKADNLEKAKTEDERLQALKAYNEQVEQEMMRHQLALGQIGDAQKAQEDEQDPLKSLKDDWDNFWNEGASANNAIGTL
jgi:DNA repair exonuclease SbcCD ATPase subunit